MGAMSRAWRLKKDIKKRIERWVGGGAALIG